MIPDVRNGSPPDAMPLAYARRTPAGRWRWPLVLLIVALVVIAAAMLLPSLNRPIDHPPELRCRSNLRQIGQGVQMYANENRSAFPPDVGTLLVTQDLTSEVFVCYATNDTRAEGATTQAVAANMSTGGHLSYVYTGKGMSMRTAATAVLAYEPLANHGDHINVLYADGRVERLGAKQGRKLLAELAGGYNPPRAAKVR